MIYHATMEQPQAIEKFDNFNNSSGGHPARETDRVQNQMT
jgi:hypothetical protein